jgi:hypothetical protein
MNTITVAIGVTALAFVLITNGGQTTPDNSTTVNTTTPSISAIRETKTESLTQVTSNTEVTPAKELAPQEQTPKTETRQGATLPQLKYKVVEAPVVTQPGPMQKSTPTPTPKVSVVAEPKTEPVTVIESDKSNFTDLSHSSKNERAGRIIDNPNATLTGNVGSLDQLK